MRIGTQRYIVLLQVRHPFLETAQINVTMGVATVENVICHRLDTSMMPEDVNAASRHTVVVRLGNRTAYGTILWHSLLHTGVVGKVRELVLQVSQLTFIVRRLCRIVQVE